MAIVQYGDHMNATHLVRLMICLLKEFRIKALPVGNWLLPLVLSLDYPLMLKRGVTARTARPLTRFSAAAIRFFSR
jgi:hypothetical protein